MRKFWVFRVSGGEPFTVQVKGSPAMKYQGDPNTVLQTLCTEEQAQELQKQMRSYGCSVEAHCPQETSEQKQQRKNVLQVLGGERVFPCVKCPECSWFDPHLESLCGAGLANGEGWDAETMAGRLSHEKHAQDFKECPLREDLPVQ